MTQMINDTYLAWYRRQHPEAPVPNERCLATLCSIAPPYRLPIVEDRLLGYEDDGEPITEPLPGGGITVIEGGRGIRVLLEPHGNGLATADMDHLTTLVIAAHRNYCRVSIDTAFNHDNADEDAKIIGTELTIWARVPAEVDDHLFARHPGLDDLAARALAAKQ